VLQLGEPYRYRLGWVVVVSMAEAVHASFAPLGHGLALYGRFRLDSVVVVVAVVVVVSFASLEHLEIPVLSPDSFERFHLRLVDEIVVVEVLLVVLDWNRPDVALVVVEPSVARSSMDHLVVVVVVVEA